MKAYLVKTDENDNIIGDGGNKILFDSDDVSKALKRESKNSFWLGAGVATTLITGVICLMEPVAELYDVCVDKWKRHKEKKKMKKDKKEED